MLEPGVTTGMSAKYKSGDKVKWKWGNGWGKGTVKSSFTKKVTRKLDGKEISRNGTAEDPAYYIEVENASNVLKLESEIQKDS